MRELRCLLLGSILVGGVLALAAGSARASEICPKWPGIPFRVDPGGQRPVHAYPSLR
jgi:hypothetical protein